MSRISRTMSFFNTWLADIIRQPMLILILVLGPFLVLLAFGYGVNVKGMKPEVILVRNPDTAQPIQPLPEELNDYVTVVEETSDLTAAIRRLQDGEVDAVAVVPPDAEETVMEGERIPLQMFTAEIDPLTVRFTEAYLGDQVGQLNQRTIEKAIEEAQSSFENVDEQVSTAREYLEIARSADGDLETIRDQVDAVQALLNPLSAAVTAYSRAADGISFVLPGITGVDELVETLRQELEDLTGTVNRLDAQLATTNEGGAIPDSEDIDEVERQLDAVMEAANSLQAIPPDVLSAPFELQLENLGPWEPAFLGYYSPAVLVLLVQHLGISLAALALTRIRILGITEILTVAPIRPVEIMNGQFLSYGIVVSAVGLVVLGGMRYLLDVPLFGPFWQVAVVVVILAAAALGIGFLISLISSSEQQATQFTMLLLLGSVFFSGLVISLERLAWPAKGIAYALPSTHATRDLHDIMLRGDLRHPEGLLILGLMALVAYALSVMLLQRRLRPR